MTAEERPPSLLNPRPIGTPALMLGLTATVAAHVLIPLFVLGSQWLLVLLGLAIPPGKRDLPTQTVDVVAAEFVKLGKPFDPRKLPQRKVPPMAKRKVEGVGYTPDAKEQPEKKEEKEKPREFKESALDNLIDRTKEFAEDVPEREEEGDPNGIKEGTATEAKAGDLYAGQLRLFFLRNWTVPNNVQNPDKLVAEVFVDTNDDGSLESVSLATPSGDDYFDNSTVEAVQKLIEAKAALPEGPPEVTSRYFGKRFKVKYRGVDLR
jgi:outer membrane biosynthesis protein TonB